MFGILAILLIGFIIVIHEFGHFIFAKLFKVGVVEYSIGMGPAIFHKRLGETVYSLRIVPMGGYCAMYGEQSAEAKDKGEEDKDKDEKPKKKKKDRFFFVKEPDFKKDWTPDRSYKAVSKLKQIIILAAGPGFNILLSIIAAIIFVPIFGGPGEATIKEFIFENSPAEEAGLEIGDVIVAVEGTEIVTSNDYTFYMKEHPELVDSGYNLTVRKSDNTIQSYFVVPTPYYDKDYDIERKLVGIYISSDYVEQPLRNYPKCAVEIVDYWTRTTFDGLEMLVTGQVNILDMTGIVGTTSVVGEALEESAEESTNTLLRTMFILTIFVSINLGIFNLIPFPALDGGRIVMALIELITKKTFPERLEMAINTVGFGSLILLMIAITVKDVLVLIGFF